MITGSVFDPIYSTLGTVLAGFFALVPSFGLAIALLTVTVRVAMIPLTAKQIRSQRAMQRLSPQLRALQAKHKGDRQKLNEETMKFYKENSFNPMSGCLPVILQAPLFIVLYRLIDDLNAKPPLHLPTGSAIYDALLKSGGSMPSLGTDLARSATDASGLSQAFPVYLLVALVVATGFYQGKQMAARLPKDGINAQMAMVGKVLPVFMGFISLSIPAGVVVYFIVSNLWQIGQQAFTFRGQPLPGELSASSKQAGQGKEKPGDNATLNAQATLNAKTPSKAAKVPPTRAKPARGSGKARPVGGRSPSPKAARPKAASGRVTPPKARSKDPVPPPPSAKPSRGAGFKRFTTKDQPGKDA